MLGIYEKREKKSEEKWKIPFLLHMLLFINNSLYTQAAVLTVILEVYVPQSCSHVHHHTNSTSGFRAENWARCSNVSLITMHSTIMSEATRTPNSKKQIKIHQWGGSIQRS